MQAAGQGGGQAVVDEGEHHGHHGNQQDAPPPALRPHAGQRLVRVVGHGRRVAVGRVRSRGGRRKAAAGPAGVARRREVEVCGTRCQRSQPATAARPGRG